MTSAPRAEPDPAPSPDEEAVWRALADPTRRAILDLLRAGPLPSGKVSERFAISRFGIRKHLQVLQQAGLVLVEERGRERWNHLDPVPIRSLLRRWIRPFEEVLADHLLDVKRRAEGAHAGPGDSPLDPDPGSER